MATEDTPGSKSKFEAKYHGPYKILSRSANGSYTLLDPTAEKLPRRSSPEQLKQVTQALDARNDESYEIEQILDHSLSDEGMIYTVKWKGYDSSYNQQIKYDNLTLQVSLTNRYYHRSNRIGYRTRSYSIRISRIESRRDPIRACRIEGSSDSKSNRSDWYSIRY